VSRKACPTCGFLESCFQCQDATARRLAPAQPKPIDLDALAKAAYDEWYGPGYWDAFPREHARWHGVVAAVLKAAGIKTEGEK